MKLKITFTIDRPAIIDDRDNKELKLALQTLEEVKAVFEKNKIVVLKFDLEEIHEGLQN